MHENVPVRFGRGRLDSLGNKGLAAYLIAGEFGLRTSVDQTEAGNAESRIALGVSALCARRTSARPTHVDQTEGSNALLHGAESEPCLGCG